MPKIIEDARGKILASVRDHIQAEGWDALVLRTIASRAGVAPGTIYNYFSSREEIAFTVVGEDFSAFLSNVRLGLESTKSTDEAIALLFASLKEFMTVYSRIWEEGGFAHAAQGQQYHARSMENLEQEVFFLIAQILSTRPASDGIDRTLALDIVGRAFLRMSMKAGSGCLGLVPIIDRLFEAETLNAKEETT